MIGLGRYAGRDRGVLGFVVGMAVCAGICRAQTLPASRSPAVPAATAVPAAPPSLAVPAGAAAAVDPFALSSPVPPLSTAETWEEIAKVFAAANPGNEGLARFAEALEEIDAKVIEMQKMSLTPLMLHGWKGTQPQVEATLSSQRTAFDLGVAAANAPPFVLPPVADLLQPVPDPTAVGALSLVLLLHARQMDVQGAPDQAALEGLAALQLINRLRARNVTYIIYTEGATESFQATTFVTSMVVKGGLKPETVQRIGAQIYEMDHNTPGVVEAIRTNALALFYLIRRMAENETYREKILKQTQEASPPLADAIRNALADLPAFAIEYAKLRDSVLEWVSKPCWERRASGQFTAESNAKNPLLGEILGDNECTVLLFNDLTTAHFRICEALCALALNNEALAQSIIDPFSGKPLRMDSQRIWSVGPDGVDNGGQINFNLRKGLSSPGDIVIHR